MKSVIDALYPFRVPSVGFGILASGLGVYGGADVRARESREVLGRLACQIVSMLPEHPQDADITLELVDKIRACLSGEEGDPPSRRRGQVLTIVPPSAES